MCALGAVLALDLVLGARNALAWGPGVHVHTANFALENLQLLLPQVANLIARWPQSFLYGCLSPDIFIGKSYLSRPATSHSWPVAQRLLAQATCPPQQAFAYGYLSHLAADTVAHNLYVPGALKATRRRSRLHHLYWEIRFEHHIPAEHYRQAEAVLSEKNHRQHDLLVQRVLGVAPGSFQAKKGLLLGSVLLHELKGWQHSVALIARNSRWQFDEGAVERFKAMAARAVTGFLQDPEGADCLALNPMGQTATNQS